MSDSNDVDAACCKMGSKSLDVCCPSGLFIKGDVSKDTREFKLLWLKWAAAAAVSLVPAVIEPPPPPNLSVSCLGGWGLLSAGGYAKARFDAMETNGGFVEELGRPNCCSFAWCSSRDDAIDEDEDEEGRDGSRGCWSCWGTLETLVGGLLWYWLLLVGVAWEWDPIKFVLKHLVWYNNNLIRQ